jgi:hypothetical protein
MLRIGVAEMLLLTFTPWVQRVRKSRTQLHTGGVQTQGPELSDQLGGYYGVEG